MFSTRTGTQEEIDQETSRRLLAQVLGRDALEAMSPRSRDLLLAITFAGCCAHKDMNAFKYGVASLGEMWEKEGRTPPILLANKANASTIRLGDADSAAVQAAADSSSRGGAKATMLAGALFNRSDDKKGYQDIHRDFMVHHKKELYGDADYSSGNGYSPATLSSVDGRSLRWEGQYCVTIFWPYLRTVRSDDGSVRNSLDQDMIDLHRKLPAFCDSISEDPGRLVLEPDAINYTTVTLDGQPFMDPSAVMAIRILAAELPDLKLAITAMFSGVARGWRQFTQEFVSGGPFDNLTPEQRSRLFIPATNDVNEGSLGGWRVSRRSNPNLTATSFSNKTRYERNNTGRFIEKLCNEDDQRYVMRTVRAIGASGENMRFRKHLLEAQRKRAETNRKKKEEAERKKREEIERLTRVGLVTDRNAVLKMTVAQLKDQIKIHKQFLSDPVLAKVLQKDLKTKCILQFAVLAAITRNEEKTVALLRLLAAPQDQDDGTELSSNEDSNEDVEHDPEDDIDEDDYF